MGVWEFHIVWSVGILMKPTFQVQCMFLDIPLMKFAREKGHKIMWVFAKTHLDSKYHFNYLSYQFNSFSFFSKFFNRECQPSHLSTAGTYIIALLTCFFNPTWSNLTYIIDNISDLLFKEDNGNLKKKKKNI